MLAKVWSFLSNAGVNSKQQPSFARYIILTNRFSIFCGLLSILILVLLIFSISEVGFSITRILLLLSSIIFFGIVLLNKYGFYTLSRWMISWLPVVMTIFISFVDKIYMKEAVTIKDFFNYRFLIMVTSVIPLLVFSTKEIKSLLLNLIPSFVGTVLFNQLHKPFGLSFNDFGYNDPHFYLLDIMIALAYFGFVGFLLSQRFVTDRIESQLYYGQEKLIEKYKELHHMNQFINEQNHEITTQSDKLKEINDALLEAKETIEEQKQLLEDQNKNLEAQVLEKTKDLSRVNEELIINYNELRQFSHTLSHNLKSPVATFQGLLNLIEKDSLTVGNQELYHYLNQEVFRMQEVFSDMNKMLELRNSLYTSVEHVDIQKEIDRLHNTFYLELRKNNIQFHCNCNGVKFIETNEERLNGILFQLISNAIKFRSDKRNPEIKVNLNGTDKYHSIKVWDNGIGIDLEKYSNKLFYPYQKFNKLTGGKGLGLYLVKLQTESLGGSVNIHSEPDVYTEVEIQIKK